MITFDYIYTPPDSEPTQFAFPLIIVDGFFLNRLRRVHYILMSLSCLRMLFTVYVCISHSSFRNISQLSLITVYKCEKVYMYVLIFLSVLTMSNEHFMFTIIFFTLSHHSTKVSLTKVNNNFHTTVSDCQLLFILLGLSIAYSGVGYHFLEIVYSVSNKPHIDDFF